MSLLPRLLWVPLFACTMLVTFAHAQNNCLEERGTPGCSSSICSAAVCVDLPACCTVAWDGPCVAQAGIVCEGCGSTPDSCLLPHTKKGCADEACCDSVCAQDDYCCNVEWDDNCSLMAQILCDPGGSTTCGDPEAGSCFVPHPPPSCSDLDCCEQVCAAWDSCCTSAWDNFCVSLAYSLCATGCDPGCPADAQQETETCGSRTNDPVFRPGSPAGTPQTIQRNRDLCGHLTVTSTLQDVDVYVVSLAGLDTDQDGVVKMRVLLSSASPMFAAVVPVSSTAQVLPSGSLLTVDASGCGTSKGWTCVAPTFWWVVVARGSGGVISGTDTGCESGKYLLRVETDAVCGNPCGSGAGNCFAPHASAGCADAACCAQTCAMIPDCCDIGWDSGCAVAADDLCGAPAPANDACAQAARVTEGSWPLTLFGATVDGGAFTAGCSSSTAASSRDVWFRWNPSRSGECQIDLCGAEWDTRLEVFEGSCGSASIRGCGDDSPFCTPSRASRLTFQASCGKDYLIRVSGPSTERGVATLRISTPAGPSCCVGDLDLSGSVDAGDIGALLVRFGDCSGAGSGCPGDLDGSGSVDAGDIGALLIRFGDCS